MITTGSKLLIGATVLAAISAIAYGIARDGVMGTIGLASAAVALGFLATMNVYLRDSNVPADAAAAATSSAATPAPGRSIWPFVFAFGAVTIAVGLISYQSIFIIGIVAVLAAGAQWTVQAWAEGASSDRAYNAEVRGRVANSLEFPLLGAIGVGIIVYAFSRVMLWLSKTNTVVAFAALAAVVLIFAFLFAWRPSIRTGAVAGVLSLGAIGVIAGGVAAGLSGERDIHVHETIEEDAAEICDSPEEFEVDENASQTVAIQSNVAARVTLTADGLLEATVVGSNGNAIDPVTFPRSNPSNVIFTNQSSEHRRLSVFLGTEVVEAEGEEGEEEEPVLACTALVEEGGQQLLTLTIGTPSLTEEDGFRFFVPGVESAEVGLVVP